MFFCGNCTESQRNFILIDNHNNRNNLIKLEDKIIPNPKYIINEKTINENNENININPLNSSKENEDQLQIIDYPSIKSEKINQSINQNNNNTDEENENILETIQNIQIGKIENNEQVNLTLSEESFSGDYLNEILPNDVFDFQNKKNINYSIENVEDNNFLIDGPLKFGKNNEFNNNNSINSNKENEIENYDNETIEQVDDMSEFSNYEFPIPNSKEEIKINKFSDNKTINLQKQYYKKENKKSNSKEIILEYEYNENFDSKDNTKLDNYKNNNFLPEEIIKRNFKRKQISDLSEKTILKKEPLSESLSSYRDLKDCIQPNNNNEQNSFIKKNQDKVFTENLDEKNKKKILENIEMQRKILQTVKTEQNFFFDLISNKDKNKKSNIGINHKRNYFDLSEFKIEQCGIDIISTQNIHKQKRLSQKKEISPLKSGLLYNHSMDNIQSIHSSFSKEYSINKENGLINNPLKFNAEEYKLYQNFKKIKQYEQIQQMQNEQKKNIIDNKEKENLNENNIINNNMISNQNLNLKNYQLNKIEVEEPNSCPKCEEIYRYIIINQLPLKKITCLYCHREMNEKTFDYYYKQENISKNFDIEEEIKENNNDDDIIIYKNKKINEENKIIVKNENKQKENDDFDIKEIESKKKYKTRIKRSIKKDELKTEKEKPLNKKTFKFKKDNKNTIEIKQENKRLTKVKKDKNKNNIETIQNEKEKNKIENKEQKQLTQKNEMEKINNSNEINENIKETYETTSNINEINEIKEEKDEEDSNQNKEILNKKSRNSKSQSDLSEISIINNINNIINSESLEINNQIPIKRYNEILEFSNTYNKKKNDNLSLAEAFRSRRARLKEEIEQRAKSAKNNTILRQNSDNTIEMNHIYENSITKGRFSDNYLLTKSLSVNSKNFLTCSSKSSIKKSNHNSMKQLIKGEKGKNSHRRLFNKYSDMKNKKKEKDEKKKEEIKKLNLSKKDEKNEKNKKKNLNNTIKKPSSPIFKNEKKTIKIDFSNSKK